MLSRVAYAVILSWHFYDWTTWILLMMVKYQFITIDIFGRKSIFDHGFECAFGQMG